MNLQYGFVAADEYMDLLSCHKRISAIIVLCIKSLKKIQEAFVTYIYLVVAFPAAWTCATTCPICFAMQTICHMRHEINGSFFFPSTGRARTWVQLSSVHIKCICQSVGISFGSPVHWGGYAREARTVFGVCFFMYLVSLLIESCGFVCSAGPCLLWHSEKWHVHTNCNHPWHTR